MSNTNTVSQLAIEFGLLLESVREAALLPPEPVGFLDYLNDAGIGLQEVLEDPDALRPILAEIVGAFQQVESILTDGPPDPIEIPDLLAANQAVVDAVRSLADLPLAPDAAMEAVDLPRHVLNHFVLRHLQSFRPTLYHALLLFGIATEADPSANVPAVLHLDRLGDWVRDPADVMQAAHGWGTSAFNPDGVMRSLSRVLSGTGFRVYETLTTRDERDALEEGTPSGAADRSTRQLRLPLLSVKEGEGITQFGLTFLALLPTLADDDGGFALVPYGNAQTLLTREIASDTTLRVASNADATVPFGLIARPTGVAVKGLDEQAPPSTVDFHASIVKDGGTEAPVTLFAHPDVGALQLSSVGARFGVEHSTATGTDAVVSLPVKGRLALRPPDGDGFLGALLPEDGVDAPLEVEVGWSDREGLFLGGSGGLEATVPVNRTLLGALSVDAATYAIGVEEGRIPLSVSIRGGVALGPFRATVDGVGIEVSLSLADDAPNGRLHVGYKPPDGLGLSVDAGVLVGGGYLHHDAEKGEYAGLIQLKYETLVLTGVGLLNTRRPDGRPGFSLVILITGEFPPVPLGLGFTLDGVGGLLGVNRTANVEALQDGMRSGTLDSLLFPEHPVANAPRIVSDLATFFPQSDGSYLLGPMAVIGWGTVPVLRAEVGMAFEFPDPLRLLLFGQVDLGLPSLEEPVMDAHFDVLGAVDFNRGTLALDAALVDSTVAGYRIQGDASVRVRWKEDPRFALSVGGFHPRAVPPAAFPPMRRVQINLTKTDNPRVRLEGYFALTPNTVQCGAHVEAVAKKGRFSAEAFLGFDTLFHFDPFRFLVEIAAGAAIKAYGRNVTTARLDLRLSGPRPWHVAGTASFKVIWRVQIAFDVTIGEPPSTEAVQPVDVRALLLDALRRPASWTGQRPPRSGTAVSLRDTRADAAPGVLLHPQSQFGVRQTVIPLGTEMDTYGAKPLKDDTRFQIMRVSVGDRDVPTNGQFDAFAPAQFFDLSDAQKLTIPAYQTYPSGVTVDLAQALTGATGGDRVPVRPGYEAVVVDASRGHRQTSSDPLVGGDGAARLTHSTGLSVASDAADDLDRMHRRTAAARRARMQRNGTRFPGPRKTVRLKR